jgi:hypothetical protein
MLLELEGEARAGAIDETASDAVVTARGGVAPTLVPVRGLRLELAATVGYTLVGLEVTDASDVVSGASGLELGAWLGLSVEL